MGKSKARQALEFVQKVAEGTDDWVTLHNSFWGIGGKASELFPARADRTAFAKTPEFQEISDIKLAMMKNGRRPAAADVSGKFLLRLPVPIHAALIAEAEAEDISLNQLCLSKLAMQLRAMV